MGDALSKITTGRHVPPKTTKELLVHVKTGAKEGTEKYADVWFVLHDDCGLKTQTVKLNAFFKNDQRGQRDCVFHISCPIGFHNAEKIEIWRDNEGLADSWYLEYLIIEKSQDSTKFWFPINRWILPDRRYNFRVTDCFLPQLDPFLTQRSNELMYKRRQYQYTQHIDAGPVQVKYLPEEEDFRYLSLFKWDFSTKGSNAFGYNTLFGLTDGKWEGIGELLSLYQNEHRQPSIIDRWKDDSWFAAQRIQGVNPVSIKLCTELPERFIADAEKLEKLLDNMPLNEAIKGKRIFIVDYRILKNLPCKDDKMICSPVALFHLNRNQELLPLAIQLFYDVKEDNPVFYPTDPPNTWLLAKMYFNNADATYHRACLSIGKTHILMESFWVSINRHISPSHPLYKLMAPHFCYLLTVNQLILQKLLVMGGWLDRVTTPGMRGICHLVSRWFYGWNFNKDMDVRKEIESRGVLDSAVLPCYPYRDDAILLYDIIYQYVKKIIENHYEIPEKIVNDTELQNWRKELVQDKKSGGCEIHGIPGDNNGFVNTEQIAETITGIISTCTIIHAAVDLPQYEESAFVPNYPLTLRGPIPRDKEPLSQKEIMDQLPTIQITAEIIKALKILSGEEASKPLGCHQFVYLREESDVESHRQFLEELQKASDSIKKRNAYRKYAYRWLDPDVIPDHIIA